MHSCILEPSCFRESVSATSEGEFLPSKPVARSADKSKVPGQFSEAYPFPGITPAVEGELLTQLSHQVV